VADAQISDPSKTNENVYERWGRGYTAKRKKKEAVAS
jgi:hypothetical protein